MSKNLDYNFSGAFNRTIMKKLMCSLIAVPSVALGSRTLAAVDEPVEVPGKNIVTGTVVSVDKNGFMEISHFGGSDPHTGRDGMGCVPLSTESGRESYGVLTTFVGAVHCAGRSKARQRRGGSKR